MEVVLDANIFVSCHNRQRQSGANTALWHDGELDVFTSEPILAEIRRVIYYQRLRKAHRLPDEDVEEYLRLLARQATVIDPNIDLQVVKDDPDDDRYIECTVRAGAQFIITSDKHLLKLEDYEGIQILTPTAFLAYLQLK